MCPSLIEIGLKTAEKNSAQTNKQTDRHNENNGHLAWNQYATRVLVCIIAVSKSLEFLVKVRRLFIFFRRRQKGFDFDDKLMFFDDFVHYRSTCLHRMTARDDI